MRRCSLSAASNISGLGREGGRYAMEEVTEVKWVTIPTQDSSSILFYRVRKTFNTGMYSC